MSAARRGSAGFTLVEVLVAMTVLAVLVVVLFGGVRLGRRAWEAGDRWADRSARMGVIESLLRAQVGQAQPVAVVDADGRTGVEFDGVRAGMRFVAPSLVPVAAGALDLISLQAVAGIGGRELVVSWQAYDREPAVEARNWRRVTLVDRIGDVEFAYYGSTGADEPVRWHAEWRRVAHLPNLVRVRFRSVGESGYDWPDLVVRLRLAPTTPEEPGRPE
jgi:general secretion pathway protein J